MPAIQLSGPAGASVMILGEFPTEHDIRRGEPFIGGMGFELTKLLQESGLHRGQCALNLVMKDRVKDGKVENIVARKKREITLRHVMFQGMWVLPEVVEAVETLRQEILLHRPNVVCPMGNLALWALTGQWGVQDWRSSIMESCLIPGLKVIPTYNPSVLAYSWKTRNIIVHDLKRVARHRDNPRVSSVNYKFVIRMSYSEAESQLQCLLDMARESLSNGTKLRIGADIETRAGHIACIAFAWSPTEAICIPLMSADKPEGYWTLDEEAGLVHLMYKLCQEVQIIGQNWNYDAQYIHRWWHFLCPDVVDTMIQHHSCFSNLDKNLAFLSSMYLEDHLYWKDDRTNWVSGPKGEGEDTYWKYNCTDSCRTLAINRVLDEVVKSLGMTEVNAFQQSLLPCVLDSMLVGVRVDQQARINLAFELQSEVDSRMRDLEYLIGSPINIKSPKQMQDFFYRQMGQKTVINKKTKRPTCNDEALRTISAREPLLLPVTKIISELRSLGVFNSTFVQAGLDVDGRMRCSYGVAGTETYRFNSKKNAFGTGMNMQNVPKGGRLG